MKVLVTGGTGYAGPAIIEGLLDAGHEVRALEHRQRVDLPPHPRLTAVTGNVLEPASLMAAMEGCDAVAHLVAIIREEPARGKTFDRLHVEATGNVIEAARAAGIRRFLLMSANGVEARSTPYFETKWRMEAMVKAAPFDWTIFRPSYIAGAGIGGFDAQFAAVVDRFPVLPNLKGGKFEIQPVSRSDVGRAFGRAAADANTFSRTYVLAGPERLRWREYLERLAALRRRRRLIVFTPAWAVLLAARFVPWLFPVPVSPDQLRMLMAGNVGDPLPAAKDLGLALERWEHAVAGLARD